MQINSKSIFLRRVNEALLLKKISKRTANHFMSVYKKFDLNYKVKMQGNDDLSEDDVWSILEYIKSVWHDLCVNFIIGQFSKM